LDPENTLFHFKLSNVPYESEDMIPDQYGSSARRSKRHVYTKIDMLRRDDRVEYVLPQYYLSRHKRRLDYFYDDEPSLLDQKSNNRKEKERYEAFKLNSMLEASLDQIAKRVEETSLEESDETVGERKKLIQSYFAFNNRKKLNDAIYDIYSSGLKLNETRIKNNLEEHPGHHKNEKHQEKIKFNDENFNLQWYLIDDGQLKIPLYNDLNVKNAWLSGYTGKNVTIVIVDDGLDYEHPDFLGKYVRSFVYFFEI
jgi:subtilisin family serine protease